MISFGAMIDNPHDQLKFKLIYDTYKSSMFTVANSIIRNEHDAEDIIQLSLMKVIRILPKIKVDSIQDHTTKNLLITITKNTAIDLYRKHAREPVKFNDYENAKANKTAEDLIIENDDYKTLIKMINSLDAKYLDVLRLRCMHHLSSKETAKILNISEQNVNTRLIRAKRILSDKLKECKK